MFLSSCFFLSWSWKFPGNVFKALVSTHCSIQWCSLPSQIQLSVHISFLYTEHIFSAASENSFSESWTTWSFFSCLLASVEILFSILFHSQSGFGCLCGIYISSIPVLCLRKKKVLFPRFFNSSSIHFFVTSKLISLFLVVWLLSASLSSDRLTGLSVSP